jgi:hypothetical protein
MFVVTIGDARVIFVGLFLLFDVGLGAAAVDGEDGLKRGNASATSPSSSRTTSSIWWPD